MLLFLNNNWVNIFKFVMANVQFRLKRKHFCIFAELAIDIVFAGIGWESGASFINQSQSEVKQDQSKRELLWTLNWKPLRLGAHDWSTQLTHNSVASFFDSPIHTKFRYRGQTQLVMYE